MFYKILEQKGAINKDEKIKRRNSKGKLKFDETYEKTLKIRPKLTSVLETHFAEIFTYNEEKQTYYFKDFPSVPMNSGKNFYFFFFKSLNKHNDLYSFFEQINNQQGIAILNASLANLYLNILHCQ